MKACGSASALAMGAWLAASAIGACRDAARPEIPPVTVALADGGSLQSAATLAIDDGGTSGVLAAALEPPIQAKFVDTPAKLDAGVCQRVLVAVVKGKVSAQGETLAPGDVLVVTHGDAFDATGTGTVVWAITSLADCPIRSRPAQVQTVIRASAAPRLEWAGGTMSARLDVAPNAKGASPSPELYLGRLEGTAPVAEHTHPTSWEIIAAVEASGTFVLDGAESRLSARQIVMVPPGAKHAWTPEAGSKLVALQMYSPPGPEQRFVALASAAKKVAAPVSAPVKDAGARDAR